MVISPTIELGVAGLIPRSTNCLEWSWDTPAFSNDIYFRPGKLSLCYPDLLIEDAPAKEPSFSTPIADPRRMQRPLVLFNMDKMEQSREVGFKYMKCIPCLYTNRLDYSDISSYRLKLLLAGCIFILALWVYWELLSLRSSNVELG